MKLITCPKCEGYGILSEDGSAFNQDRERPAENHTCERCKGSGEAYPRFFIEFFFDNTLSKSRYWFPLFILSDDKEEANRITEQVKRALEAEGHKVIDHSRPLPEVPFTKDMILSKQKQHQHQRLATLNVDEWKFHDIDPELDWTLDDNLNFIVEEGGFEGNPVATRIANHEFPVRVVHKGHEFPEGMEDFLLIHLVNQ